MKCTIHRDTIVIGAEPDSKLPDDPALLGVFFDGTKVGRLAARIKSIRCEDIGGIEVNYRFTSKRDAELRPYAPAKLEGQEPIYYGNIKPNQKVTIPFLKWDKFQFSTGPDSLGMPLNEALIGNVSITFSGSESNPTNNNIISKLICKTHKADIGVSTLRLQFGRSSLHQPFGSNFITMQRSGRTYEIDGQKKELDRTRALHNDMGF